MLKNHTSLIVIIEKCMNTQPFSEWSVLSDEIGKDSIIWGVGSKSTNGALGKAPDWPFIVGFEIWKFVGIWKNVRPFQWNYFWADQINTNVPNYVIRYSHVLRNLGHLLLFEGAKNRFIRKGRYLSICLPIFRSQIWK